MKTKDSLQTTIEDLRTLLKDAEQVLADAGDDAGEKVAELRTRMNSALDDGRGQIDRFRELAEDEIERADEMIRAHPYHTVGLAAAIGMLAGILLTRKD